MISLHDTLESMIDKHGLAYIVQELASICDDKSDHIQANYANGPSLDPTAANWTRAGARLSAQVARLQNLLD